MTSSILGCDGGSADDDGSSLGGTAGFSAFGGSSGTAGDDGSLGGGSQAKGGASSGGTAGQVGARTGCTEPPAYRNLFAEVLDKSQSEVDQKIDKIVDQLFFGSSDQTIYYEMGSDQAYILDVNNNDIRSEGMSYGMLVAVLMDMKTEYDKLWKFAANRMRQSTGLFAWQLDTSGGVISPYAAPDGEEYIAMALLLASRRWGDSTGTNYGNEAKAVMKAMATQDEFNQNPAIVQFGPYNEYTDPSYVLPLFYSEWACFDSANASLWKSATTYARTFFQKTTHKDTGLAPYQANWDGSPYNNTDFNADAWRVPMNIMMDYNLNHADDEWQKTWAKRMADFWVKEGLDSYGSQYSLSGQKKANNHGAGLTGVNAMLAFALSEEDGKPFLERAWNATIPTGQYRYYDGCLYMLSMLHLSGKFQLFN